MPVAVVTGGASGFGLALSVNMLIEAPDGFDDTGTGYGNSSTRSW